MDLFDKVKKFRFANGASLNDLIESGLYPYGHVLSTMQNPEVKFDGRDTIMLGSNNYLGLTSHPDVIKKTVEAVKKYGSGCSGSRYMNGTNTLHIEVEEKFRKFLNKTGVFTTSTGFGANLAILSTIAGRGDYILSDKENHASIYDGCKLSYATMLRYEHGDMADLEEKLKSLPEKAGKLIVTDGVFSMSGEIAKLPEIVKLAKKYGARTMVDDAHAFGVLGKNLRGTAEHFGLEDQVDIYMGTFSKSLASLGGYIAGDKDVIEYIRHTARPYIFTASMTPASAASAIAALDIMSEHPERRDNLISVSKYAAESYKKAGLPVIENKEPTPIVPIFIGEIETTLKVCCRLMEEGLYVNPVVPPAVPMGQALIRTSYMATHTKEQVDKATAIFKRVFEEMGLLKTEPKQKKKK